MAAMTAILSDNHAASSGTTRGTAPDRYNDRDMAVHSRRVEISSVEARGNFVPRSRSQEWHPKFLKILQVSECLGDFSVITHRNETVSTPDDDQRDPEPTINLYCSA